MIFWATLAIINAIWATSGTVDWGTFVQIGLVGFCLLQLIRAEKAAATRNRTLT